MKNNLEIKKEEKNYLLRGGIIGAGIYFIIVIFVLVNYFVRGDPDGGSGFLLLLTNPLTYLGLIDTFSTSDISYLNQLFEMSFLGILSYFIIGVFAGWFYKKYKMRGQK